MAKRRADRAARADTFELVANEWLELQGKALAPETLEILSRRLKGFFVSLRWARPVGAITAQELLATLRRI